MESAEKQVSQAVTTVSVLVAVYNAERFLAKCLDSLLAQTMADVQVICVDDASTDGSAALLADYARRDDRVEVVTLESNQGQAHARNVGLKQARGRFIAYLDSDDWMAPDALAQAVATFKAHPLTDCVLLRLMNYYGDTQGVEEYGMARFDMLSGREAMEKSLDWTIHGCYVARRWLYERYQYDESRRAYSDDNTTRLHYLISREVRECDGAYYYRNNMKSVTRAVSPLRFEQLGANESMRDMLRSEGVGPRLLARYETLRWLTLVDTYMFYHCHGRQLGAEGRRRGLAEMRRVWHGIDRSQIDQRISRKMGYRPMSSWALFRAQEWLYFTLRGLLGKNK